MEHFIWNADPVIFSIGGLSLRWYGLFFVSGFLIGFYIMGWIFREENKNTAVLDRWLFYIFVSAVIGARLGHCLFYDPAYYLANPLEILFVWQGGLASHGGTAGVLFGTWLFSRNFDESFLWLLDRLAIPTALASALIRLGNFFNSEITGIETDSPLGIVFARISDKPLHPAQLYESLSYLITFAVLYYIYRRYRVTTADGMYLGIMMLGIFASRFMIEFIKPEYASYDIGIMLNLGQLLSLPFILLGVTMIIFSLNKARKPTAT
jgi:phosphatidylglycerol:prolipoprotein diacylglycerol transferase